MHANVVKRKKKARNLTNKAGMLTCLKELTFLLCLSTSGFFFCLAESSWDLSYCKKAAAKM